MKLISKLVAAVLFVSAAVLQMNQANAAPVLAFNIAEGGAYSADLSVGGTASIIGTVDKITYDDGFGGGFEKIVNATINLVTGPAISSDPSMTVFTGGTFEIVDATLGVLASGVVDIARHLGTESFGVFVADLTVDLFLTPAELLAGDLSPIPPGGDPFDPNVDPAIGGADGVATAPIAGEETKDGGVVTNLPEPMTAGLLGLGLLGLAGVSRRRKAA